MLWSMTESYKPDAHFDVFEYTIQKLALVGLAVFYPDPGSYEQLILGIFICFGYTMLLVYYRPYASQTDNTMVITSQIALFVAMLQSVLIKDVPPTDIPPLVTAILVGAAAVPPVLLLVLSIHLACVEMGADPATRSLTLVQTATRNLNRRGRRDASQSATLTDTDQGEATDPWIDDPGTADAEVDKLGELEPSISRFPSGIGARTSGWLAECRAKGRTGRRRRRRAGCLAYQRPPMARGSPTRSSSSSSQHGLHRRSRCHRRQRAQPYPNP